MFPSRKALTFIVIAVFILVALSSCYSPPSMRNTSDPDMPVSSPAFTSKDKGNETKDGLSIEETPTMSAFPTVYINQELRSSVTWLKLNADVEVLAKDVLPTYISQPFYVDVQKWKDIFFEKNTQGINHLFDTFNLATIDALHIDLNNKEKEFAYERGDDTYVWMVSNTSRLVTTLRKEATFSFDPYHAAQTSSNNLTLNIEEAAKQAGNFVEALGLSGMVPDQAYMQKGNAQTIVGDQYYVELSRMIDTIPICRDQLPLMGETINDQQIIGDFLRLCLDDEGIYTIEGFYREILPNGNSNVNISLDKAIGILQDNMDFVYAYGEQEYFNITEIGLVYLALPTLPLDTYNTSSYVTYRPVWRFASDVARGGTDVFTFYVDVETGEVYG